MSHPGNQLKSALGITALVAIYGISILVLWFFGPSLGIGGAGRVVLIALILLTWPVAVLINHYRKNSKAKTNNPAGKKPKAASPPAPLPAPTGTYEELTRGTEEAVQWLRSTNLGRARPADAVYALPWFLIAGPPASGKTSLMLSSGFDFHTLPGQRAADQNTVRPTANCEWRVTDSAILLDTSGRYQSDGRDRDEWAALIETIKQYRRARPLDGFVIAASAAAVLGLSDAQIEQQAKVLRARLDEAIERTRTRFPVYLVFTHMDVIEGFADFFRAFSPEERAQVWGTTIPLAEQQNAHALFDAEFDHLYGRLLRRRSVQLGALASPGEQLRSFKFPGRFRRARNRLGLFAAALLRPNPFSESPLLRGFYFASSNHRAAGAGPSTGEEYFARNFFNEVLLRDKDVLAATQAKQRKPRYKRALISAGAGVLSLAFFGGVLVSFSNNKQLINRARTGGQELMRIRQVTSKNPEQAIAEVRELEAMETVRELLGELDEYERNSPPAGLRFGLYAGGDINAEHSILRHLYFEAVDQRFLKPTVSRIEVALRSFASAPASGSNGAQSSATEEESLGRHYDLLKAYLMLVNPDRVEGVFLASVLRDHWKTLAPPGKEEEALKQLDFFAGQAGRADAPHPEVDDALVARAQSKLVAYPVVNRVYKRLTTEITADVKYPVNLTTIPGAREGNLLTNPYSVPGAFTIDGYRRMSEKLRSSAADEFRRDDWVMTGSAGSSDQNFDVKRDELADMYYRDYAAHWQKFLQEMKLREYKSKEDAVKTLRILSGGTSPLEVVAREVARQTNFSAEAAGGFFNRLVGFVKGGEPAGSGMTEVEKEFRPLIQFVSGEDDASLMAEYRARLKNAGDQLSANPKSQGEIAKALQAGNDTTGLRAARQTIADLIDAKGFTATPAGDAAATMLKQPLDNLNTLLVGADFEQIDTAWQQLYAKSWQPLESRFPFAEGSDDASVTTLAAFLNPEKGELTKFFNERLKPYFGEDWSPKQEAAEKFSPEFIDFLRNARRLRDNLFPAGGSQPGVEYQIAFASAPKNAIVRVEIDGNVLEQDKPTPPFRWPGDKSGVKMSVMPISGAETGQTQDPTRGRSYAGEWGLLRLFGERGGGDERGAQFELNVDGLRLSIQPKSGNVFRRELFTELRRAPKSLRQGP